MHEEAGHAAAVSPFHTSQWPRSITDPDAYDGGERLSLAWDLSAATTTQKKKIVAGWVRRLPELRQVRRLNLWTCVTQPLFEAVCEMPWLECLQIKWSHVRGIDSIARLRDLHYLYFGSSTKIPSVEPLAALRNLRMLHIENFRSVTDFMPLTELTSLESLAVLGSMWTRQRLTTLEPFARMTSLTSLALDSSGLKSLRPLAHLRQLVSLHLGNRLPMEEYAWLAAKLPDTQCQWFGAYLPLGDKVMRCPRCKGATRVMLTGRGASVRCLVCDEAEVRRHAEAFEAAKAAAAD